MKRAWSSSSSPGSRGVTSSNGSLDRIATPLKVFWPCTATLYPSASNGSRGKASSTHLVSCRQTMSGSRSLSQATALSTRCLIELTFQVAIRMGPPKIGASAVIPERARACRCQAGLESVGAVNFRRQSGDQPGGLGGCLKSYGNLCYGNLAKFAATGKVTCQPTNSARPQARSGDCSNKAQAGRKTWAGRNNDQRQGGNRLGGGACPRRRRSALGVARQSGRTGQMVPPTQMVHG